MVNGTPKKKRWRPDPTSGRSPSTQRRQRHAFIQQTGGRARKVAATAGLQDLRSAIERQKTAADELEDGRLSLLKETAALKLDAAGHDLDLENLKTEIKDFQSKLSAAAQEIADLGSKCTVAAREGYNLCLFQHKAKWEGAAEKWKRNKIDSTAEMVQKEKAMRKREKAVERIEQERSKHQELQVASSRTIARTEAKHKKTKDELVTLRESVMIEQKQWRARGAVVQTHINTLDAEMATMVSADVHEAQRATFTLELMAVRRKLRDRIAGEWVHSLSIDPDPYTY
jgi:hypothetical protein